MGLWWFRPAPGQAQEFRVRVTENFRRDSSATAPILASVNRGTRLAGDDAGARWKLVTLRGWIWSRSVDSTSRDGFHLVVSAREGENLRAEPAGPVLARLETGALLRELDRSGDWVMVSRDGWMWGRSLERVQSAAAPGPTRPSTAPPAETSVDMSWAVLPGPATIRVAPDGDTLATASADVPVRVLARSGGWVRVQAEGWVRAEDVREGAPGVLIGVSGAEVRSRPQDFEGKTIQWRVQFVAVQRADEVRFDIPAGQRYLLVRGPYPETGFVYVTVSDQQVARFEQVAPLTDLVMVGRVRTGRSRYLGNPVIQLIDFTLSERTR